MYTFGFAYFLIKRLSWSNGCVCS